MNGYHLTERENHQRRFIIDTMATIVHLTDLHLDMRPGNLDTALALVRNLPADMFLIGGDNGGDLGLARTVASLHELRPDAAIGWVMGNHDLWFRSYSCLWDECEGVPATYLEVENLNTAWCTVVGTYGHYDYSGGDPGIPISDYARYCHGKMVWNDRHVDRRGMTDPQIAEELASRFQIRYHDALRRGLPVIVVMHTCPFEPNDPSLRSFFSGYCVNRRIGEILIEANVKPQVVLWGHTHQASRWEPFGFQLINPGSDYDVVRVTRWELPLASRESPRQVFPGRGTESDVVDIPITSHEKRPSGLYDAATRALSSPPVREGVTKTTASTQADPFACSLPYADTASPASHQAVPSIPGYQLLRELGRGGMGIVYMARHLALDRLVALKVILSGTYASQDELARFQTEARAVARLQHPNIVQLFEAGQHVGLPFLAFEFLSGGTLADELRRQGALQANTAANLIEQLARGVEHAHQRGVIHRDLKPANVILTEDGVPKVTDFGLARQLESEFTLTATGAILGTPSYMAPEQTEGKPAAIGASVDVWALGAILYTCLTGRPPFQGTSHLETLEDVRSKEPPRPSSLNPDIPEDLQAVCLKCLAKESEDRYPSAAAMAEDLRRFLANEPISTDLSRGSRWWKKWARKIGYEIAREFSSGPFGRIFVAWQVSLDRNVLLKVFGDNGFERTGLLTHFRAAARAHAKLQHPNILPVSDSGERDGLLYVAEELVEGINLEESVGDGIMRLDEAVGLIETLARAMHHAHERGVIHCNLKPRAILLMASGTPRICNFEFAWLSTIGFDGERGRVAGTPLWMAPEQAEGRTDAICPGTDVWALGAILYRLICGHHAFSGDSVSELLEQIVRGEPIPPSGLRSGLDPRLDEICMTCLHKRPVDRYESAEALAVALRAYLRERRPE